MRVRAARIRREVDARVAELQRLKAVFCDGRFVAENFVDVAIAGDAVKARDARFEFLELGEQCVDAGGELFQRKIAGFDARTFCEIGEADAEFLQSAIVLRRPRISACSASRACSLSFESDRHGQNRLPGRAK